MKTINLLSIIVVLIALLSCKKKNDENNTITKEKISGYVQKGPFTNGTTVNIYELNGDYSATGKSYNTQISNNNGSFQVNNVSLASNYIDLQANGYYYNEVSGALSTAQLTLTAMADVSNNTDVNVNLLTQLEKPRVEYLLSQGVTYNNAKTQAQHEVLNIFNINISSLPASENLNIAQNDTGDAALLAVSCILQGFRTEAELTELLSNISNDIKTDGVLTNNNLGSSLINHAVYLDTITIRNNLVNRFNNLGISANIPDFETYIRNFINSTSFTITDSLISYPSSGLYGENILNLNQTSYSIYGNKSFTANLKNGTSVKIKMKRLSGNIVWLWDVSSAINWSVTLFDDSNYEQTFSSINTGTNCNLRMLFNPENGYPTPSTFLIEYYEMNSANPTRTKTITVN